MTGNGGAEETAPSTITRKTIVRTRRCDIKKDFIVERQGRSFVLYAGLLDLAHSQGLKSIETNLVQIPSEANNRVAICTAIVTMEKDGVERVFTGIGDAAVNNVAPAMALCLIRMSETRAKARALRDAVNIGVAAFEELGEADAYDGAPERGYQVGTGRSARPAAARVAGVQRLAGGTAVRTPTASVASQPTQSSPEQNGTVSGITDSQANAVRNLCRRAGIDADAVAMDKFKLETLDKLTQAQAGELIKALSAQTNGRNSVVTI